MQAEEHHQHAQPKEVANGLQSGQGSRPIVPIWRSNRPFPLPQSEWLRCSGIILSYLKPWMPRRRSNKQYCIALLSVFICGMAHAPNDFSSMPLLPSFIFAPCEQSMHYMNSFSVPFQIKRILWFKSLSWTHDYLVGEIVVGLTVLLVLIYFYTIIEISIILSYVKLL